MAEIITDNISQIVKSPFTKDEQIQAILSDNTQKLVREFAGSSAGISSSGFFDWLKTVDASKFFVVTAEDIYQFAETHGFPSGRVEENGGLPEDKFVIDKVSDGFYETYVVERGQKYTVRAFSSLSEARTDIVKRMMILMRVSLNLQPYILK